MNLNPGEILKPVFHFLDEALADYGVYLYLVLVWLSLILIAWIFGGGLRRKSCDQPYITTGIGVVVQPSRPQSPEVVFQENDSIDGDREA